jgi:hypothetical protein
MSSKPIAPDSGFNHLIQDGYEVEVQQQHLLLHEVPYVGADRFVRRGTLVCTYIVNGDVALPPDNHQVWWSGEFPCFASGQQIHQIANESGRRELFAGCIVDHRFSNKPDGPGFEDHYSKLVHYVRIIQDQAKVIDPQADARTSRRLASSVALTPFQYADSASARAAIQSVSEKLALKRVAIVGVGGTGAYVLDQIAKTPVQEIHLFDGDIFEQHNAFRSPGAASLEDIRSQLPKSQYFQRLYSVMHRGIVSHPYRVVPENVSELKEQDFVFVCVDEGRSRAVLCDALQEIGVPFIDVGMSLHLVKATSELLGACRVTLCTPNKADHLEKYVPREADVDEEGELYRENIQVADMNALNAQLAVMKWKQFCGFYQDDFGAHNLTFTVNFMSLSKDACSVKQKA